MNGDHAHSFICKQPNFLGLHNSISKLMRTIKLLCCIQESSLRIIWHLLLTSIKKKIKNCTLIEYGCMNRIHMLHQCPILARLFYLCNNSSSIIHRDQYILYKDVKYYSLTSILYPHF